MRKVPRLVSFVSLLRPPGSTLFPYTTLFRSVGDDVEQLIPVEAEHGAVGTVGDLPGGVDRDRKSTRLNSSHSSISYAVFCLKKKINGETASRPPASAHGLPSFPACAPRCLRG